MNILQVVLPVFVMIGIGMICKRTHFLTQEGIDNIKKLITKIILPVAIFHALATADYSLKTWMVVGVVLVMIIISFGLGFIIKPVMKEPYKKYLPFMVSIYEGGMIAYPLFLNLCGSDQMSKIAMIDIAGLLFGFSIYMSMLQQTETGKSVNVHNLIMDAVKNPAFVATVLGIVAGLTGLIKLVLQSSAQGVYIDVKNMITTSLTAMILIVVGYDLDFRKDLLRPCVGTIICRVLVQAAITIPTVLIINRIFSEDNTVVIAAICYMSAPATFSMQSFLKTREGSEYAATTNSLYCIVSVVVYVVMAFFVKG